MSIKLDILRITITDSGTKTIDRKTFSGNVLNNSNFKIYVLKLDGIYLYIGKTKQKIGAKFRQGFKSYINALNGKRVSGYGGYKWIKEYISTSKELKLFVFDLGLSCSDNNAEAIEAEIVFQIRKNQQRWPEYQNEIHFNNDFANATDVANEIIELTFR